MTSGTGPATADHDAAGAGCPVSGAAAYDPLVQPYRDDPFTFYTWARQNAPVLFDEKLGAYLVTRYDDILDVLHKPELFSSTRSAPLPDQNPPEVVALMAGCLPSGRMTVFTDPPRHTPLRRIANRAFIGRRINAMRDDMRRLADSLIDEMLPSGHAELVWQFAHPFVSTIAGTLLGIPRADIPRMLQWSDDLVTLINPLAPIPEKLDAAGRWKESEDYLIELIEERRRTPRDDMISDAIHSEDIDPRGQSLPDLIMFIRGTYTAGIETTRGGIISAVHRLLTERSEWETVCADPSIVPAVFEETLRRDAPHRGLMRTAVRDAEIGGTPIPADAQLLLLYGSANRDDSRFPDAEAYRLGRENVREHLAFGGGIHLCPGAHLARVEGKIALEALTDRIPGLRLADTFEGRYVASHLFRCLERLEVDWEV